jgi:hypothetical protein
MLDTPLLETLRTLNKDELQKLQRFVNSPISFHEDNTKGVIVLFDDIIRFAPDFSSTELKREATAERLKQTPQYLTKLMSGLHRVVRNFIIYQHAEAFQQDFFGQLTLLKFYRERGQKERFETLSERLLKELKNINASYRNEQYYRKVLLLEAEITAFHQTFNLNGDQNIINLIKSLDEYYWILKSQFVYELSKRANNVSLFTEGVHNLEEDIKYTKNKEHLRHVPLLDLFQQATKFVKGDKSRLALTQFETLLERQKQNLTYENYTALSSIVRHSLQIQHNKGDISVIQQLFDTYRHHLYRGLLYRDGYLQPMIFSNIVRIGCRTGKLKWVGKFLEIHKNRIGGTTKPEEVYRLYLAFYLIYNNQAKEAETYLEYDFDDLIIKTDAKRFELMAMFLNRSDLLEFKLDAFRKYLRNTAELPDTHKISNHNFVLILRKMLNPDLKRNNKKIEKLIADVKAEPTSEAMWLIVQLEKLKKRT